MYCKFCGEQLSEDAAFCQKCGKAVQSSNQKTMKPNKKKIAIVAVIIVIAICAITVLGLSSRYIKVDASKLFVVSFDGLNGDGKAVVEIDEAEWNRISEQVIVDGSASETSRLMSLQMLEFDLSKESYLSNGDEITLAFDIPDDYAKVYGFKVINTEQTIKVEGLPVPEEMDVFEGIKVEFSGRSPFITCTIITGNCNEFAKDYVRFKTDKTYYTDGEAVEIKASYDDDALVQEKVKVLSDTTQFTATSNEAFLDSLDGVDLTQLHDKTYQQLQLEYNAADDLFADLELGWCNHYNGTKNENAKGNVFLVLKDKYDFDSEKTAYNIYGECYRLTIGIDHTSRGNEKSYYKEIDVLLLVSNLFVDENNLLHFDDMVVVNAAEVDSMADLKSVFIKENQDKYNAIASSASNDAEEVPVQEETEWTFDFTDYAGTYIPCSYIGDNEDVSNMVLNGEGIVTGSVTTYDTTTEWSGTRPVTMEENEDGSITFRVSDSAEKSEFYILYPVGVKDRNDMFDSSKVRIEYIISGGGIIGYTYYKEEIVKQNPSTYTGTSSANTSGSSTNSTTDTTSGEKYQASIIEEKDGKIYYDNGSVAEIGFGGQSFWDILNDPNNEVVGY